MIKIYHNPRCSKSRAGFEILKKTEKPFEVINYLENPLSISELSAIITLLDIPPIALVRKNEVLWKANYKHKELTDDQIIEAMVTYPKLIQRPIVINNDKAIIGRPPEVITKIL